MRGARELAVLGVVGGLVALPSLAEPEERNLLPIDVEVPASLEVGTGRPHITLTARRPLKNVSVVVERRGARAHRFRAASLRPGRPKTFRWNERPGIYTYGVKVEASQADVTATRDFTMKIAYLPPIKVVLARSRVDLERRRITFQLNQPAERAELVVRSQSGVEVARSEESYDGAAPGTPLSIGWPATRGPVGRIDLTAHSTAGFWAGMALVPWAVSIPHEEVEFETDRWEIRPSEAPKLDEAIELIEKALAEHGNELSASLYVAGFTDTVGSKTHNRTLSEQRARAIAAYFRAHRVRVPILFRGYGEEALAVGTRDETAEPRNRRAAYVLATQPPVLSKTVRWGVWKRL